MPRGKTSTVSLRTSEEIKGLFRQGSEREHRSVVSMDEVLVMDYARQHAIENSLLLVARAAGHE